jgi:hypothetical protein
MDAIRSQYQVLAQKLLEFADAADAPHRRRKVLDQSWIQRINDDRLAVPDGQRHFSRRPVLARQCDDCRAREHVDVVAGQVVRALRPAVRQVRVNREFDERVRVPAFAVPRSLSLALGRMPMQMPLRRGVLINARLTAVITPPPPPVSRLTPRPASASPTGRAYSSCSEVPEPITPTVVFASIGSMPLPISRRAFSARARSGLESRRRSS